tara:strand:+ start:216 stop:764 length:549 start_codon:yes stop_codon:yes gene_type:complete
MFNLSTKEVVSSIENASLVKLNGILYQEYKNFFGKTFKLPDISEKKFTALEFQEHLPRKKLDQNETFIKQLRIFFMNSRITEALENKFDTDLKFKSVDIWQDYQDYYFAPHTDDERIKLALQLYIGDNDVGTSLFDDKDNVIKTFEFSNNNGYALLNNNFSRHGTSGRVTKGTRTSIYVRYT